MPLSYWQFGGGKWCVYARDALRLSLGAQTPQRWHPTSTPSLLQQEPTHRQLMQLWNCEILDFLFLIWGDSLLFRPAQEARHSYFCTALIQICGSKFPLKATSLCPSEDKKRNLSSKRLRTRFLVQSMLGAGTWVHSILAQDTQC